MIFIDSNIPMYLVGVAHRNKERTVSVGERLVRDEALLVTDAQTLHEILHRYTAIERTDAIQPAYDALLNTVDEVFAVGASDPHALRYPPPRRLRLHGISTSTTFEYVE